MSAMTSDNSNRDAASAGGRASQRAYEYVRAGILSGEIKAGTLLGEGEIAEQLGISRTPVRQALKLLLQEELVAVGYRRQLVVLGVSPERRREVFLLRTALERVAIREACKRMSLDDIDQLRLLVMRQRRAAAADSRAEFVELDEEFHRRIALGGDLPMLDRFLGQLRAFVRLMGTEAIAREGRMLKVVEEHEALVDAIERRDEEIALRSLEEHLSQTEAIITEDEPVEGNGRKPARKPKAKAAKR